jgi:hypothetical protein
MWEEGAVYVESPRGLLMWRRSMSHLLVVVVG